MTHPDESSWQDDLRVDAVQEMLVRAVEAAALAELEMPHIVVCRDTETGAVSYAGPFPTGMEALTHAERETAMDRALNDGAPMEFGVAALYPWS